MSDSRSAAAPSTGHATPGQPPAYVESRTNHMPQLDGVRGLAILAVIVWHFDPWTSHYVAWGPIGVRMFFVMGAFLVTNSLLRARDAVGAGKQSVGAAARAFSAAAPSGLSRSTI